MFEINSDSMKRRPAGQTVFSLNMLIRTTRKQIGGEMIEDSMDTFF